MPYRRVANVGVERDGDSRGRQAARNGHDGTGGTDALEQNAGERLTDGKTSVGQEAGQTVDPPLESIRDAAQLVAERTVLETLTVPDMAVRTRPSAMGLGAIAKSG